MAKAAKMTEVIEEAEDNVALSPVPAPEPEPPSKMVVTSTRQASLMDCNKKQAETAGDQQKTKDAALAAAKKALDDIFGYTR